MKIRKSILRTPLFKVTSLNSVSLALKIGSGLITSKVLAVYVGPAGVALVGNLRNFMSSVETASTIGFQNGIIKYIAEYRQDAVKLRNIFSTTFYALLLVALLLSLVLFTTAGYLNTAIFGVEHQYINVFKVLALALPWYSVSVFLIAAINGLGKYRQVIYTNIIGNVMGLLFSVYMVTHYHTFGALLTIVVPPALLFFAAFYFVNRELSFFKMIAFSDFHLPVLRGMMSYSMMALVSSVLSPLVFLALRNFIIESQGIEAAGYIEAMNRLSAYYMMFVSTILTVYFLPKLAMANSPRATKNVLMGYFKGVLPLFGIGMIALYLLRFVVIQILFTNAFLPVAGLFLWQLVGDTLKAAALILGYQFFAKSLTTAFIVTEVISLISMFVLTHWLVKDFGAQGFVMAHAFTYAIYLLLLVVYFRKNLFI